MAGLWMRRSNFVGNSSEIIGYKSGLVLTREEFGQLLPTEYHHLWFGDLDDQIRIRSEELDEIMYQLLYRSGGAPSPKLMDAIFNKDNYSWEELCIHEKLEDILDDMLYDQPNDRDKTININGFIEIAKNLYDKKGYEIGKRILDQMNLSRHLNYRDKFRHVSWENTVELKELFESESLQSYYGKFIDQRYIDFLSQNFELIGNVNWRKFEALTCEFFDRQGYYVEIGDGRNDGGIDGRAWSKEEEKFGPPTILIQCKRYKEKIDKMVVKALWADVYAEGAESGLIVTTSSLSPGAEKVRIARNYPIEEADRSTLKSWINLMRTPFTGAFLSE